MFHNVKFSVNIYFKSIIFFKIVLVFVLHIICNFQKKHLFKYLWSDLKILLFLSTLFSEWNFITVHLKHKSFLPKNKHFLLKENNFFFFFLPLYVTRSNFKYLLHNQDFCFYGSKSICTVSAKKILLLTCATRTKWITDCMENSIYSKAYQPEHHRFHSSSNQSSRYSAGTMNLSGFGLMP